MAQDLKPGPEPRAKVDCIDLADDPDSIRLKLMHSSYSRLPLIRNGAVDEPLGFVHKKELLKEYLAGNEPNLEHLARRAINLLESFSILNALEQMRQESTHIAWRVVLGRQFEHRQRVDVVGKAAGGHRSDSQGPAKPGALILL